MRERITVAEAAAQLGCSVSTVRRFVKIGKLDGTKYTEGKTPIYVSQASVNALQMASRVSGQGAA
jgi:excisionase family DNA binding protein